MLGCPDKLIQGQKEINLEPKFEKRIVQFRDMMEKQGTQLQLAIVKKNGENVSVSEIVNPNDLYFDEIDEEIEAVFNGCLKVLNVSANRVENNKFNEYDMDFSQEGAIIYNRKEKSIPDEMLTDFQKKQKDMEDSLESMNEKEKAKTRNTLKVKFQ